MAAVVGIDVVKLDDRARELLACLRQRASQFGAEVGDLVGNRVEVYARNLDSGPEARAFVRDQLTRCGDDWELYLSV